jgi:hypothetical protein
VRLLALERLLVGGGGGPGLPPVPAGLADAAAAVLYAR